ncbi:MAG: bifunctional [glutamate--ammonia ligase]-adenylyl-L-tyrosine phosphorylase/[glutamate--ammonia-ligase] adenylyltransferase [Pseudomonadota bacterium]
MTGRKSKAATSAGSAAAGLPAALREPVASAWEAFVQAMAGLGREPPAQPEFVAALQRVWACSDFVAQTCVREPEVLCRLLDDGCLLGDYAPGEVADKLELALRGVGTEAELSRRLREFRRQEMLRIAWRDLAGWAPLDEVLYDLSALADACIGSSLDRISGWAVAQAGAAPKQLRPALVVLGMGKLGAHELNFSSDIDLIFAYPDANAAWHDRHLSADEFYLRIARQLVQVLDAQTAQGFVFRVDMRLRPYGDSGSLVASFDAMADYYQLQGREWERYAMIKARPVAGPAPAAARLMALLHPFVYRRYLDFGAFESLRSLKEQIIREVERRGMQDNIKLGPGGIREIEFIAQAFQLVRGGREPVLQQRGVLAILAALVELGYLPETAAAQLTAAYVFLRRTENRLQAWEDRQVHTLPEDEPGRARLAFAMGYPDWERFARELARHRGLVAQHFEQVFAAPRDRVDAQERDRTRGMDDVWRGTTGAARAVTLLENAGYQEGEEVLRWLAQFRQGPVSRFLGEQGKRRLDELMPQVLHAAAGSAHATEVLKRMGALLEAIAGRTTYLSLLVEHPAALGLLARLCAASSWIANQLALHPILLDELLDPRALFEPLDRDGLRQSLQARMAGIPPGDLEQQMDQLRQYRQAAALHVAATDIVAGLPVTRVADHLTDIAEVVLETVLRLAWAHQVARHGPPAYLRHGQVCEAGFAIVGYGKLGGYELGYGSDLDIVFLHDSTGNEQHTAGPRVIDNVEFFTRLSQRIIHILNTFTAAGVLYEVDMRLRPNGNSGLLVSSVDAFEEYQRASAWTWENQALIRARVVVGNAAISRRFGQIRREVLTRPRDVRQLQTEVADMRRRMRTELDQGTSERFDLKHGAGGIVDIEFMVQFMVLRWSGEHERLLHPTATLALLQASGEIGVLPAPDAEALSNAYRALRERINHRVLAGAPALIGQDELLAERAAVCRVWQQVMGEACINPG